MLTGIGGRGPISITATAKPKRTAGITGTPTSSCGVVDRPHTQQIARLSSTRDASAGQFILCAPPMHIVHQVAICRTRHWLRKDGPKTNSMEPCNGKIGPLYGRCLLPPCMSPDHQSQCCVALLCNFTTVELLKGGLGNLQGTWLIRIILAGNMCSCQPSLLCFNIISNLL